jgi:hypothetical protein
VSCGLAELGQGVSAPRRSCTAIDIYMLRRVLIVACAAAAPRRASAEALCSSNDASCRADNARDATMAQVTRGAGLRPAAGVAPPDDAAAADKAVLVRGSSPPSATTTSSLSLSPGSGMW